MKRKLIKGEKAFTSMPVEIKGIDKENYMLTMVASTQDVDRHGDTVIQSGWDIKPYSKNPVILDSHRYGSATEVIARAISTRIEGKGKRAKLIQEWKFAVNENPKAKIIFDLYAGGFLHASSVGFIPRKFAEKADGSRDWFVIEEAELLEVSAVSVPANAYATAKAKGIQVDDEEGNPVIDIEEETEETTPTEEAPEEPQAPEEEETEEDDETPEDDTKEPTEEEKETPEEPEQDTVEEETPEPEPTPAEPQKSYKAKVVGAIEKLESREKMIMRKTADILQKLLQDEQAPVKLNSKTREQIRKRQVNKAIRMLFTLK
jgi:HK97 family phage prohead protease